MNNTITNNNTRRLTADQLWDLIDLAFPVKTQGFRIEYQNTFDEDTEEFSRKPYIIFYNPSRSDQRYTPELREWSVAEIKKLKAVVEAFGYSVRIGEASGPALWPIVHPTAE